jgi:hypothetical protein
VASTGIWVFVVPIIVNISNLLNNSVNHQTELGFQLAPNSILLLYFSAFSFFLGCLVFQIFCPNLIKLTNSFSMFEKEGMSEHNLTESLSELGSTCSEKIIRNLRKSAEEAYASDIDENKFINILAGANHSINLRDDQISKAYWITLEFLSSYKKWQRMVISTLFIFGFFLIAIVFFKNLVTVAAYVMNIFKM